MPLFDISYTATNTRLMTIEAPTITEAALLAPVAAPHCDGLGVLQGNITVRHHRPPCNVAFFAAGFFQLLADTQSEADRDPHSAN